MFTDISEIKTCNKYVSEGWYVTGYLYVSMIIQPVVPFVLITVMNSVILYTICKRKNTKLGQSISQKIDSQLTAMFLLISIAYLVLTFPFEVRKIYSYYTGYGETPQEYAVGYFFLIITFELIMMNNGMNFFLYLMSGAKFRKDLKFLFSKSKYPYR